MKKATTTIRVHTDSDCGYYDVTVEVHSLRGEANCDPYAWELEIQAIVNAKGETVSDNDLPEQKRFYQAIDKVLERQGCPIREGWHEKIETTMY